MNFKRIYAIFLKEFIHIKRDARSLAIVLIAPVALLILYGYAVTFDIKKIDIGVVDNDRTQESRMLVNKFLASGYFELYEKGYGDIKNNINALRINKIKVILVIPDNFTRNIKKRQKVNIQLIIDGSDANTANIAANYAKIIIATYSRDIILNIVRSKGFNPQNMPVVEPMPRIFYNPELKSVNFIVPGLIAVLMMLVAGVLTSLAIVREKEWGTFEQLISTPAKPLEIIIGKLSPYVVIGCIDVALVTVAGLLWFKVPFKGNPVTFIFFTLLFIFCAMGQGLFMSSIAKNQTVAVIATAFSTLLPSILLSDFIFPLDSMPWFIRIIAYIVPAKYFLTALRSLFLKEGTGISVLYPEAIFLIVFGILFIIVAAKRFKKSLE